MSCFFEQFLLQIFFFIFASMLAFRFLKQLTERQQKQACWLDFLQKSLNSCRFPSVVEEFVSLQSLLISTIKLFLNLLSVVLSTFTSLKSLLNTFCLSASSTLFLSSMPEVLADRFFFAGGGTISVVNFVSCPFAVKNFFRSVIKSPMSFSSLTLQKISAASCLICSFILAKLLGRALTNLIMRVYFHLIEKVYSDKVLFFSSMNVLVQVPHTPST